MPIEKEVLTTGEVAKICKVASRTVSKWFDTGQLPGYRIPGSRDRRIPVNELVKFMKTHNIPLDGITSGRTRVLLVDDDKEIVETLARILTEQTQYDVQVATNGFQAGMSCQSFKPHVLLMELHLGDGDSRQVADFVRKNEQLQFTKIIAMSGKLTDGQAHTVKSQGFDHFLKKPFQVRQVVEAIETVMNVLR
jgi:excisionase family DNA binding protein